MVKMADISLPRHRVWQRAAWIALVALLAACAAPTEPPLVRDQAAAKPGEGMLAPGNGSSVDTPAFQKPSTVKIAFLAPLTGSEASTGTALLNAALMSLGDARDPRIELRPYDTGADVTQAEAAAEAALADGAAIFIGPLLSANVVAAGQVAAQAGIPLIGLSNDGMAAAPGRYILGFQPEDEISRVLAEAVRRGRSRFGAIMPEGPYGERVGASFGRLIGVLGAEVAAFQTYERSLTSLQTPVLQLSDYAARQRALEREVAALRTLSDDLTDEIADELEEQEVLGPPPFDAVLIAEGGAIARTLSPLLPFYEIDPAEVQFLGTGLWDDPALHTEPALQGAWFAAPDPAPRLAFEKRYDAIFGQAPPRLATLSYDAVGLVSTLVRLGYEKDVPPTFQGRTTADWFFPAEILTQPSGFSGLDGLVRLLPSGVNERALAVLEIGDGEARVLSPAASRFAAFREAPMPE